MWYEWIGAHHADDSDITLALVASDVTITPFENLAREEMRRILVSCIELLPENQKRAWLQRFAGIAKPSDIAPVLDAKPNIVRAWLSRGSKSLAECVNGRMGPGGSE